MFHLNKTSQIVTVSPDIRIYDYEKQLTEEGLTGGYRPLSGYQTPLSECLALRVPNIYFLKYGGIEELCVGGEFTTRKGVSFQIKTVPRSATGCDLRRVVIGSESIIGQFKEITLKVFPQPESSVWGLAFFDSPPSAVELFRKMFGVMIRPLFIKIMEEEGAGLVRSLNLEEEGETMMVFKLAGLKGMVEAEKDCISRIGEKEKVKFCWLSREAEVEVLEETIVTPESYQAFASRFSALVGMDFRNKQTKCEDNFRKFLCSNGIKK